MNSKDDKMKVESLAEENRQYRGTAGVSEGNRASGFVPAFLNKITGDVYPSCFSNGRLAPVHMLDGLPANAVHKSVVTGRAYALQDGLVSGFILGRRFYTREEASLMVASSSYSP